MRRLLTVLISVITVLSLIFAVSAIENDKIVVVIDAGHGGYDGGTITGLRYEKLYNLTIATHLRDELEADGRFKVIMTREDDTYLKFLPRTKYALDSNADLFLSLHCNSNDYTGVRGGEAYITVVDEFSAYNLAYKILKNIESAVSIPYNKIETREDTGDSLGIYYWNSEKQWDMPGEYTLGMKSDYYSVNTWCSKFGVPSIIVEHGYLSNSQDAAIIDSDENLAKIAKAEAEALIDYYFGHEHQFSNELLTDHPANCTLEGAMSYRCSICGAKTGTVTTAVNSDAHYWRIASSKKATCTEDGFIERVCQISYNLNDKGYDCEVHSYTEVLKASGHDYVTLEDSQPSHGHDGRLYKKCSNCGDVIEEIRPGEAHNYAISSDTSPTCTSEGVKTYRCTICGDEYTETTAKLEHDYREKERVEPTDDSDGYVISICTVCGDEKTEEISFCEHEYIESMNAPTCTSEGELYKECTKCGKVVQEVYPMTEHSYETQMEVKPSCTSEGYKREKCSYCGKVNTVSYPKTAHSYTEVDGQLVCSFCGDVQPIESSPMQKLMENPIVIAILAIILLQFAVVIAMYFRRKKK